MTPEEVQKQAKVLRVDQIVTATADPWLSTLRVLPNPDPILRRIGADRQAYDAIQYDAHVLGELRSIRAGLLSFTWRIVPGGDDPLSMQAFELVRRWMADTRPDAYSHWPDTIWTMARAVFHGWSIHQLGWRRQDRYLLPAWVVDAPEHRYRLTPDNELRRLTRGGAGDGEAVHPLEYVITRHMPSRSTPYGVAVFSACFWPHVLKTQGWKWFEKLCKRHAIPWVFGRYPIGTPQEEQDALVEGLAKMVEDAVAAIPEGGGVEAMEIKSTGTPMSERLIRACNREQSKALTSQTLAMEQQDAGARAATETHKEREDETQLTDRQMIAATFSEIFAYITWINISTAARPPRFEFFDQTSAPKDWVDVLDKGRRFLPIGRSQAYELLQIQSPEKDAELLPSGNPQTGSPPPADHAGGNHRDHAGGDNAIACWADQAAAEADRYIEAIPEEVKALAHQVNSLEALRDRLMALYPKISDQRLGEHTAAVMLAGLLDGVDAAQGDDDA